MSSDRWNARGLWTDYIELEGDTLNVQVQDPRIETYYLEHLFEPEAFHQQLDAYGEADDDE